MLVQEEIAEDVFCFKYFPDTESIFSYNSFLFIGNDGCFLVDVGFPEQATGILSFIEKRSLSLKYAILSHYHSDHYNGLRDLPEVSILGSSFYQESFTDEELSEIEILKPAVEISRKKQITLCAKRVSLEPGPGHSSCSILTNVNNDYLHLGDILIFTEEGRSALPLCGKGLINKYIETLHNLENFYELNWLLGHGQICQDIDVKKSNIKSRLDYLYSIQNQNPSFEKATRNCSVSFANDSWHTKNLLMRSNSGQ